MGGEGRPGLSNPDTVGIASCSSTGFRVGASHGRRRGSSGGSFVVGKEEEGAEFEGESLNLPLFFPQTDICGDETFGRRLEGRDCEHKQSLTSGDRSCAHNHPLNTHSPLPASSA